jgi:hypothetical protein
MGILTARVVNLVLGIINVALFIFWLSISHVSAVSGGNSSYDFNELGFQMTVLEAVIAILGLAMGALSILGFGLVVERAELKADKVARKVVNDLHAGGKLMPNMPGTLAANSLPNTTGLTTVAATREEEA